MMRPYRPAVTQGDPTIVPTRAVQQAVWHLTVDKRALPAGPGE